MLESVDPLSHTNTQKTEKWSVFFFSGISVDQIGPMERAPTKLKAGFGSGRPRYFWSASCISGGRLFERGESNENDERMRWRKELLVHSSVDEEFLETVEVSKHYGPRVDRICLLLWTTLHCGPLASVVTSMSGFSSLTNQSAEGTPIPPILDDSTECIFE